MRRRPANARLRVQAEIDKHNIAGHALPWSGPTPRVLVRGEDRSKDVGGPFVATHRPNYFDRPTHLDVQTDADRLGASHQQWSPGVAFSTGLRGGDSGGNDKQLEVQFRSHFKGNQSFNPLVYHNTQVRKGADGRDEINEHEKTYWHAMSDVAFSSYAYGELGPEGELDPAHAMRRHSIYAPMKCLLPKIDTASRNQDFPGDLSVDKMREVLYANLEPINSFKLGKKMQAMATSAKFKLKFAHRPPPSPASLAPSYHPSGTDGSQTAREIKRPSQRKTRTLRERVSKAGGMSARGYVPVNRRPTPPNPMRQTA
jgi:hypothetical protein